jgi:hypothetical protein
MNRTSFIFQTPQICMCGCGEKIDPTRGRRRKEFIHGHNAKGDRNKRWRGGKMLKKDKKAKIGYSFTAMPSHPKASQNGYVPDHVLIVEKILGKMLPLSAVVHHVDKNSLNNSPSNLVVCQDTQYHSLIHARQRALEECGHASWRKCQFCHQYDDPSNMMVKWKGVRSSRHRDCYNRHQREYYKLHCVRLHDGLFEYRLSGTPMVAMKTGLQELYPEPLEGMRT